MKQPLIEQIALAYKEDKGKTRDHICGTVAGIGAACGEVLKAGYNIKYPTNKGQREIYKGIIKHRVMQLIVASLKFYESLCPNTPN